MTKLLNAILLGTWMATWPFAPASAQMLELAAQGTETVLYDSRKDACDASDLPDAPARAFRDDDGRMVLFAPNFKARAFEGLSLATLEKDCRIRFAAGGKSDPDLLDDRTWLHAFMRRPDGQVLALASASYMPYRHNRACAGGRGRTACWYNGIAILASRDGGETFTYLGDPPGHLLLRPPERSSDRSRDPAGYITASNIVRHESFVYTIIWFRGQGPQQRYNCLLRAPEADPLAWSAWTGTGYETVARFAEARWQTRDVPCAPVGRGVLENVRSVVSHAASGTFIAIYSKSARLAESSGFYYSTSTNLLDWTPGRLLYPGQSPARDRLDDPNHGEPAITYPSLIDEQSQDANFGTVSDRFDLLFVRLGKEPGDGHPRSYRQIVRVPLQVRRR